MFVFLQKHALINWQLRIYHAADDCLIKTLQSKQTKNLTETNLFYVALAFPSGTRSDNLVAVAGSVAVTGSDGLVEQVVRAFWPPGLRFSSRKLVLARVLQVPIHVQASLNKRKRCCYLYITFTMFCFIEGWERSFWLFYFIFFQRSFSRA